MGLGKRYGIKRAEFSSRDSAAFSRPRRGLSRPQRRERQTDAGLETENGVLRSSQSHASCRKGGLLNTKKTLEELDMRARCGFQRKIRALASLAQRLPAGRIVHDSHRFPASIQQSIHVCALEDKTVAFTPRLFPIAHELKETRTLRGKRNGPQEHRPSQPDRLRLDRSRNQKHISASQRLARKSLVSFMHMGKASPMLALRNFQRRNVPWLDRACQDDAHVVGEKTIQSREEKIQTFALLLSEKVTKDGARRLRLPSRPPREELRGSSPNFRTKQASSP